MIIENSRVVVIDDQFDEVENLLRLLNDKGMSLNYYKGDNDKNLPKRPLTGVRLLFLDFVLGTDGQTPKNKISVLMRALKKTISADNGPYIILAWTEHDDLLQDFKAEIIKSNAVPIPIDVINLEKKNNRHNLTKINKILNEKIKDKKILEILLQWENHAKTAAGDVLINLSEMSKPELSATSSFDAFSSSWNSNLERHACQIASNQLGKNISPNRRLLVACQLSLINLFGDHIEKRIRNDKGIFTGLAKKIYAHRSNEYNNDEKAKLNTSFLLLTDGFEPNAQPGNIYNAPEIFKIMNKKFDRKQKLLELVKPNKIEDIPDWEKLIKMTVPILIEITPRCDYVQDKWKKSKLVFGALFPLDFETYVKDADFLYKFFLIQYNGGTYCLVFNSHYLYTIRPKLLNNIKPILQARKELLVDVQYWFSKQLARPGRIGF